MSFVHHGRSAPEAPLKDPDSTIDYGCDWSDWLAEGDAIVSSSWDVSTGLTLGDSYNANGITCVMVSGGVVGRRYMLTNSVVSDHGRSEDRSMLILCGEK